MAIYNPFSWQNETALANYPVASQSFITDAKFVQFDNFIPILNTVMVNKTNLKISINFDSAQTVVTTFSKDVYDLGDEYRCTRIYTQAGDRYLGVITFGPGAQELWDTSIGRKIIFNTPFAAETVRSIPSQDAVYSLDSNYGDVALGRSTADKTIFYNTAASAEYPGSILNAVTFNAVTNHAIPEDAVQRGLRKINLVSPVNNNINLASNDIIKITSVNAASLTVNLVAGAPTSQFTIPTLIA